MDDARAARAGLTDASFNESRFDDPRVIAAVQEFLAALESGDALSRQEFIARHPEIAAELDECLGALELVHRATPELRTGKEAATDGASSPPQLLGDFRLLGELGRGGMGVVYEAIQVSLSRRVAVKVLPFAAALDRVHLQRFRNEALAAAQLHHANIVPVYAVGMERGVHFYAMQLIEGEPLSALIAHLRELAGKHAPREVESTTDETPQPARRGDDETDAYGEAVRPTAATDVRSSTRLAARDATHRDRFRRAAELARQAAAALEHAHQFGVIHRDVKPANLLVDGHGNLWVADFGLAQIQADVTLTRTGDVLGTLRYMSPEQAAGDRMVLDHRTDIYSLGVTFYELLTLEPVFSESDRQALLRRIMDDEPRSPRAIDREIPVELETIVLKAISKSPQDRYATAKLLADDLQRWLDDKPIQARRPSAIEQAFRWCRRHRSLVGMAAVFLLLACVGLLASTIVIATEHGKTKQAYRSEMTQRLAADESFRQARQAVDAFTQLGEDELANDPALKTLRRQFLETALEYYRSFISQRRDDPLVQAELTASSARVERLIEDLAALEGYAPLLLLADERVRRELALSNPRVREIDVLFRELAEERRQAQTGSPTQEPTQRQLADILRSNQQKIAALLDAWQMQRLKQIALQQQGPFAFRNFDVITALHLTAEERTQIAKIIDEVGPWKPHEPGPNSQRPDRPPRPEPPFDDRSPPREGRGRRPPRGEGPGPRDRGPPGGPDDGPGPPFGPAGRRPPPRRDGPPEGANGDRTMHETMEDTVRRIVETLSDEQQATWRELIGEPFPYDLHFRPEDWMPR